MPSATSAPRSTGSPAHHSWPDHPAVGVRKGLRSDVDFVPLRFAVRAPKLPSRHTGVQLRERAHHPAPDTEPDRNFCSGSVSRTDAGVVVPWRELDHWSPGWRSSAAPLQR